MNVRLPPFGPPTARQAHLRLIATTDLHVHVLPYDYYADQALRGRGLMQAAGLIDNLRNGAPNSLLFDNGDFLQGNPLGDFIAHTKGLQSGDAHPMIAAMNAVGYDAATLGNHEFNYALEFLSRSLEAAQFPLVCANVTLQSNQPVAAQTLLPPYVLLDRSILDSEGVEHQIRVGVIGFLPPQILTWDRALLAGHITTRDIVEAAIDFIPQIKAEGAEIIIALCHSGIGSPASFPGMENAATALAALPGIDAIIAGHSHLVFPGPGIALDPEIDADRGTLAGKPAVMAGAFGSHVGVIDLLLDRSQGSWHIVAHSSRAEAVQPDEAPPTAMQRAIALAASPDHEATIAYMRKPVGRCDVALNSYFGHLPGNAALALVAKAKSWHVTRSLRDTPYTHVPVLAAVAPHKMGGRGGPDYYTDVPPGEIALRHVADLYIYPNSIHALLIDGAGLLCWLDRASQFFNTLVPDQTDQPLINTTLPSSHFDVIHGVTWSIDLSNPAGSGDRIRDLCFRGKPVAQSDRFIVATSSYRANLMATMSACQVVYQETRPTRDILRQYIADMGVIRPSDVETFRFHPLPGTTAVFDSSARAAAHLENIKKVQVEAAGNGSPGFARFRLTL